MDVGLVKDPNSRRDEIQLLEFSNECNIKFISHKAINSNTSSVTLVQLIISISLLSSNDFTLMHAFHRGLYFSTSHQFIGKN